MGEFPVGILPIDPAERSRLQYEADARKLESRRRLYRYAVPALDVIKHRHIDSALDELEDHIIDIERLQLDRLTLHGHEEVLDVGCGNGNLLWYLAEIRGHQGPMLGVDMNENYARAQLKIAQRSARLSSPGVLFQRGNAETLQFKRNSVDAVICNNLLHHASFPALIVKEIKRVARPGAVVTFMGRGVNNHRRMWESLGLVADALGQEREYRGIKAPDSFYQDFDLQQMRQIVEEEFEVVDYYEQSEAADGSYLHIPSAGLMDYVGALALTGGDSFERYNRKTESYEHFSDKMKKRLRVDMFNVFFEKIMPELEDEIRANGFLREEVEQGFVVAINSKKGRRKSRLRAVEKNDSPVAERQSAAVAVGSIALAA